MTRAPSFLTLLVALALALPARADPITHLRTLLGALKGATPVSATIDISRSRKSSGRFANNQSSGQVQFAVSADNDGLHITLPQALLDRAEREDRERQTDPKKMAPTRAAIDELNASALVDSLSYAQSLVRLLDIGTLQSEKRAPWQGRPARLLTFKLKEKLPPQATSVFNVNFSDDHLNLWLADDDTPLAAERIRKGSARFLFLRGEMTSRESWLFAKRDDRLVVTRAEAAFAGSGFGQRGEGKTVQTIVLR